MVCAMSPVRESLARRYNAVRPHLTERQCRVWLGAEARELGPEGVRVVADAVGVSPDTVRRGRDELDDPQPLEAGRSRVPGGGRKRAGELDPGLAGALDKLVDPESRGDPMTPLHWTAKSLRTLAGQLRAQGHPASATLVQRLLHEAGCSLQANAKTLEGSQHPDRDAHFRYIHDTAAAFLAAGDPVVSVDAKKKENVGQFKNGGRVYQPKGSPVRVNVHDFPGDAEGKAIPYGVYDIGANTGWVTGAEAITAVTGPGTRIPGLPLAQARGHALLAALLIFRPLPRGFTNRDLRELTAELRGLPAVTAGQITYDLRRLRSHQLIERIPRSHRYRVTSTGLHTAMILTRIHDRVLPADLAQTTGPPSKLRAAAAAYQTAVDDIIHDAGLAA